MREIRQVGKYHYVFSRYVEPIARVRPGETVAIPTEDAFEGRLTQVGRLQVGDMVDTYYSLVAKIEKRYAFQGGAP